MKALMVVDVQNDFLTGGSLAIEKAETILPFVRELVNYPFDIVLASKDWHPADHVSFASNHENKKVGDHLNIAGLDQILWPVHCVQEEKGSEFAEGWDHTQVVKVFYKGADPLIDSYSVFFDNAHHKSTGLEDYLREKGVSHLFFIGLATDYCVKYSVLDALHLGFHVYVVLDACRAVNAHKDDERKAYAEMQAAGAVLLSFAEVKSCLTRLN